MLCKTRAKTRREHGVTFTVVVSRIWALEYEKLKDDETRTGVVTSAVSLNAWLGKPLNSMWGWERSVTKDSDLMAAKSRLVPIVPAFDIAMRLQL